MHALDDTIAAIASPPGGAARGILRLSGPWLRVCLEDCFRPAPFVHLPSVTRPTAIAGFCWLAGVSAPLPGELYLWPGQRSYTGQPVAEIHTLGSPPLLEALLRTVCAAGARPAEPGEFTLRAFLTGRIDLTQAEAVLGVVDAADARQLHVALMQLAGGLAQPLHRLRDGLLDLLADLEARLDFAEDEVPPLPAGELSRRLEEAAATIAGLAGQMDARQETAAAVRAALAGAPNAGKSSLFNALARQRQALVSEEPGTTRDYLVAEMDFGGVRCQLIDTAGLDTADFPPGSIQQSAQAAAGQQHRQAGVRLLCLDATQPMPETIAPWPAGQQILVLTKSDLAGDADVAGRAARFAAIATSSKTGAGLDKLRERLRLAVLACHGAGGDVVPGTAARCRQSLALAGQCVGRARKLAGDGGGEELVAAELRVALEELGRVAGAVYTNDVLDRIFSRFCIGK
jgi:tRNA modification GTPase